LARVEFPADVDYYEIMHVHLKAHPAVIRKVYHVLMLELKNYPDLGGDVRAAQMIHEAYAVLSDNDKRDEYDRFRLRQTFNGETPPQRLSSAGATSNAASAGAAHSGAASSPPKGPSAASSQGQQTAPKQATVSMNLLPDLEDALSTLSASARHAAILQRSCRVAGERSASQPLRIPAGRRAGRVRPEGFVRVRSPRLRATQERRAFGGPLVQRHHPRGGFSRPNEKP